MTIDFGTLPFGNNGRINRAQHWIAAVIYIYIVLMIVAALVLTMVLCFGPLFLRSPGWSRFSDTISCQARLQS